MKQFKGKVVSTKMQKTAVVLVERLWQHPVYKKRVKRSKKYLVDNKINAKLGDQVIIQEVRPLSKQKRFKIFQVIK
jgi:small subunit ribosomal protein S17